MVQINNTTTAVSYKQETLTIPANGQITYYQPYNSIRVLNTNAVNDTDLMFRFGTLSAETLFYQGLCVSYPEILPSVTITNMTNAPIFVELAVAIGTIQDDRLTVSGTVPTTPEPFKMVDVSLETFDSNGKITISSIGYKRVLIQNNSSTDSVYLFKNNTFELTPQATFDIDLSATFIIYGTAGQKVSVAYIN